MSDGVWFSIAMLVFVAGAWFGRWTEARLWRGKATSGFRMASGGKLYNVTEDPARQKEAA